MHELRWTFTAHRSYANAKRNKEFESKLDETLRVIELMPKSFPIKEGYNIRKAVITKDVTLFYEERNSCVYLLFFLQHNYESREFEEYLIKKSLHPNWMKTFFNCYLLKV